MHNNNGFNAMLETAPDLTRRTPEAEIHFNIKAHDYASFHVGRPVVMMRSGTGHYGTSLEYSHSGGRNWQIVSFHETVVDALMAFSEIAHHGLGKDRDPLHYRILKES